jgi:hypothetical protein
MKISGLSVIMGLTVALTSWVARAADPNTTSPSDEPPKRVIVVQKKVESHKFGGLSLKGQLKKPELGYIYKRRGLRQEQIINIPDDFNGEILQGAGKF